MSNCPQHCNPILLVERIACVNEEKSPFFFHAVRLPHVINGMNSTDSRFQAHTELCLNFSLSLLFEALSNV
jgi:hypothetical protein